MKYDRETAIDELWDDNSDQATEMAHEVVEHLEDIRANWRAGYSIDNLMQEWEDGVHRKNSGVAER